MGRRIVTVGCSTAVFGAALVAIAVGCRNRSIPPEESSELLRVPTQTTGPILFHDLLAASGIDFRHTDGSSGQRYIVESVCCGLATFDYNGDGLIDVYFLNGAPLKGTQVDLPPRNALYRNEGNWRFIDVTDEAGVGDSGYGLGVTVADYDNDGDPDLYLNNFGPNVLYRNNGDGTFTDVTDETGVSNGNKVGAGTCFLDADADADLDLYVANYVNFTYENHVPSSINGVPVYAGPKDYQPVRDVLYRNEGDGTFTDISEQSGIGAVVGTGMGMVCADIDADGDSDIFVCNDVSRNFLFLNDGKGRFGEAGLSAGTSYDYYGDANASMGVDCGDFNNDGRLDFFMTSYSGEMPVLYENTGSGLFEDITRVSGTGQGAFPHVNWGTGFADFDNDGCRDLFVANGHLDDNVELYSEFTEYEARNQVLRNTGDGRFVDVSDECGDGLEIKLSSRGAALDDLDNDGDVDIVVLNSRREPSILRNDSPHAGRHWLQVELRGTSSSRDGVGSRVTLVSGDLTLVDEVHSGRGYQGHFGTRLHFGLGPRNRVERVEVRWLGGSPEVFQIEGVDRLVTLVEGHGKPLEHSEDLPLPD